MQSHASRHVESEFLKDLHPDLSLPFPKEIIKDEIAEAYGRRGVQKLIAVLDLPQADLPDSERAHALRVFKGLLSTQEHKIEAIQEGASKPLTFLIRITKDVEVRKLSCNCLASMAQIIPGRNAIVKAQGFVALTEALTLSPEAAAGALRESFSKSKDRVGLLNTVFSSEFSKSSDGVGLLKTVFSTVVPALVILINNDDEWEGITLKACENAAATLAGIASTDDGICSCLEFKVPRCMVKLIDRGLTGDFQFDESEQMECRICHHRYGKTAAREADAIRAIGALTSLGKFHPLTVSKCSSALMGVSIEKESKVPVMQQAGAILNQLLKNTCEHLEARKMMGAYLNEQEMKELLYQSKPMPPTPPDFRYNVVLPTTRRANPRPKAWSRPTAPGNLGMVSNQCEPNAHEFIQHHFADCVYTTWDAIGFVLGMASIFMWMLAQLPQFISNIRNQSAEALSIWFLAQWFVGDTLNLMGCLIQGQQLATTTFLAMYFILSDTVLLSQYVYYGALTARTKRLRKKQKHPQHPDLGAVQLTASLASIHKNMTRKSTEGLSALMFVMALCANMSTGSAIILRMNSWTRFWEQLPWIIGTWGTVAEEEGEGEGGM
eukprot:gene19287-25931_t